jgi:hypothetical protein
LHDTSFNTEIFSENKKAFENARSFMKAPTQQPEIEAKIFTNIPTFDSDSTESAKQYIDTIYNYFDIYGFLDPHTTIRSKPCMSRCFLSEDGDIELAIDFIIVIIARANH